jgi:hypothetical protein
MLTIDRFNVWTMLSPEQRARLQSSYEQEDPVTKRPWVPMGFAGAAGTRAVYFAAKGDRMALVVVDAVRKRILSLFETPLGEIRLTTDGRMAIVEERERRAEVSADGTSSIALYSVGRLSRFELDSGRRTSVITDSAVSGRATWHTSLCVGAVDDPTIFAAGDDLLVVDWIGTPHIRRTGALMPDAGLAKCVFSAR